MTISNMNIYKSLLAFVFCSLLTVTSYAQNSNFTIKGKVTGNTGKALELATIVLNDALSTYTDKNGAYILHNVPAGTYEWHVLYVGYETAKGTLTVKEGTSNPLELNVTLRELGLALKDVTVTANQIQMGSKSQIDQEAIRHIQPKSLSDLLQLVPGNLTENPNLNKLSQAHIREIEENDNNAMGTSIVMDGTPLSNDANLQAIAVTRSGASSSSSADGMGGQTTAGRGTDLRTVSPGNVESVEVIRGIPSVEYGNLTSGVVIVKTKSGYTPWEAKVQVDPFSKLVYAGKGFTLNDGSAINFSVDWSQSWGDTRLHYLGYERITGSAGYSNQWGPFSMNVRTSFYSNINNRKHDAQMEDLEMTYKNKNVGGRLFVNGDYKPENAFITKLQYNLSAQMSMTKDEHRDYVYSPDPVITNTRKRGTQIAQFNRAQYFSEYEIDGKPINLYAQLQASKYISLNDVSNMNFKLGAEYTMDANNGKGFTYDIATPPQAQGSQRMRPRAYDDIPALNTLSIFASDRAKLGLGPMAATIEGGVRFTNLFLDKDKSGGRSHITVWEPRLNATLNILNKKNNNLFDDLSVTGGFGISNKMPTLLYLYPEPAYYDYPSLAKYSDIASDRLALITTDVIKNTQNPDLKPTNTRKWEIGFNFRIGRTKGFVTYFNERHRHEFGFQGQLYLMDCPKYDVPATATDLVWDAQSGNVTYKEGGVQKTAAVSRYNDFLSWGRPSNTSRALKHGIEYGLDFGEFKPIRTKLSINGAWFHVTRISENTSLNKLEQTYNYLAVMPEGRGTIRDRFNTTFRFITHIPVIKMIFTTSAQVVWYESVQSTYQDNDGNNRYYNMTYTDGHDYLAVNPIGYYDRQGQYYPWQESYAQDATLGRMVSRYYTYGFKRDVVNPWVMLNFRFTKELGKVGELSFIANNFPNMSKWHTNKYSLAMSQLYPDSYFGAELKLKF